MPDNRSETLPTFPKPLVWHERCGLRVGVSADGECYNENALVRMNGVFYVARCPNVLDA